MSWICPECNWTGSPIGGPCPCSDAKDHIVTLIEKEEEVMANVIKFTGNTARFAGQKKGILLSAELQLVKELSPQLREHIGDDAIPRGSAIRCVYIGENGIPFCELRGYGCSALGRLKNSIGHEFLIDWPVTDAKPVPLDFTGNSLQPEGKEPI